MSTVYFPVSKIHLIDNYFKKTHDCVVNVKIFEISDELGQNLSGWQIYSGTESPKESLKAISEKENVNVVRDPNIPSGLIKYVENVFFFSSVIQVLYCLPLFGGYLNKLDYNDYVTLCNDYRYTSNYNGICIDWSLHLEDSNNIQTKEMLHQLKDPRGEYLENYRCADGCQKLNTSTKGVYVT